MFRSFRLMFTLKKSLCILVYLCFASTSAFAAPRVNRAAVLDFDGDGKTDYVVVRFNIPSGDTFKLVWYIKNSWWGTYAMQWGLLGMQTVPADYDGDRKWDIAVWSPPTGGNQQAFFHIWRSSDSTYQKIAWGTTNDSPMETQDFDGDGKADPTVVRCVVPTGEAYWYIFLSRTGEARIEHFGFCGDRSLRGDFDGDGKADLAAYRVGTGIEPNYFIVKRSSDNQIQFYPFGRDNSDRVLPTDMDGDGKTDFTVVRLVNDKEWWYWVESSTGEVRVRQFGQYVANSSFDNYAPGDYDGDGKTNLAVWRVSDSGMFQAHFYVAGSKDGMFVIPWGLSSIDGAPAAGLQFR